MRKWLKELVDQYLEAIANLEDTPAGYAEAARWADWMKSQWAAHGLNTLKQQRNLMTDVRNAIKQQLGEDHMALESMNFTKAEWTQINDPIDQQVATRNENQGLIDNPDAIVQKAIRLLGSREWADVAAALALPSPAQLEAANFELQQQITQRQLVETALQKANEELETRVSERTKELVLANEKLRTEITERQRAEASLEDEEERFEATFNSAAVGIAHVDINGKWLLVNQKLCDIVGYTQQELLERTFQDITYPEDLDADLEYVQQMLAAEIQTYSREKRYIRKDGSLIWIQLTGSLVRKRAGNLEYFISVIQDISERKLAEVALRESEAKYRTIFTSIDEGFCVVEMLFDENGESRDYLFLEVNPIFEQLTGLTGAIGKTARQIVPDLEEFWFETLGRVALTGEAIRFENYSAPLKRWFNLHASRVGGADSRKVAVVFNNITERKLAEQQIREQAALLNIATDAILVRSLDNQIIFWNKGAESLYGWQAVEAIGQNAETLLYQEISSQTQEAYETVMEWGTWQGELHQVTKASQEIVVVSRWTLVRDEQEQPKSILTVNTDITQQRKLEAQFQRTQRMESIGTLAGGIAHDLKKACKNKLSN